jgi:adenylate kinase
MRLIFLGPPGSGKGTQASLLCRRLGLEHIATGDLFRAAMAKHTPMGEKVRPYVESGGYVPDEMVNDLIAEHFRQPDRSDRFVMDGYPRTLTQAEAFDQLLAEQGLKLMAVVLLNLPDEEIIKRTGKRWSCPKPGCLATYHEDSNPPKAPGFCDRCGTALIQRKDDKPETVRNRLVAYHRLTAGLIPYYRAQGLLREVNGRGDIEEIYNTIVKALESAK